MTQETRSGMATGYRLVVPEEWFTVELAPGRRERSVAALTERQFAGVDNAPHLKAQAREELLTRAEAAYEAGGLEMFLSMQQVAGIPIAASLVTFLVPPSSEPVSSEELARSLADDGRQVSVLELPAGNAVRVLRRSGSGGEQASANLEVFAPVPGGGWLLMAFAAPLGPLVPALTKLFDAICMTLRWDR